MIILDTNVLSEIMRPHPDATVLQWLESENPLTFYTTSFSLAELLFGAARLPSGKRKSEIERRISIMFDAYFEQRVLSFIPDMARAYAHIASTRQRSGRTIASIDAMIAATALTHNAAIATRDRDFSDCGVTIIDPWTGTQT